jgi:uncharacterized protein (DUF4415 family)
MSAAEIDAALARGESRTDWAKVDSITEEALDRMIAEDPDEGQAHLAIDWSKASFEPVLTKKMVNLRLDRDVVDFFKSGGRGYQTKINAVLRSYVQHARKAGSSS